jgi:hypothetical protein
MKNSFLLLLIFVGLLAHSQTKQVLFLGNSYTAANNLPVLTAQLAGSVGDTLIYDSNTPGGYTLEGHSSNSTSLDKIINGNWDFVVLQDQSQRPSLPLEQVEQNVFPYAKILDSINLAHNPCGETMFYMTWGRKNGDASNCDWWPPVCSYQGMDSLLHLRYMIMADDNQAVASPVGAVWHYIRDHFPHIELYSQDESHPSAAGSYAAACSFYTAIFRKDPTQILFNGTINSEDAATIRLATKVVVYDSLLNWNIGKYDLTSDFYYEHFSGYTYQFYNQSENHTSQLWDFGPETDTINNPAFTFAESGSFEVSLTTFTKCDTVISVQEVMVLPTQLNENNKPEKPLFHPNPAGNSIYLDCDAGDIESVSIFDLSGKELMHLKNPGRNALDTKTLKDGIYVLEIVSQHASYTSKLIIKR